MGRAARRRGGSAPGSRRTASSRACAGGSRGCGSIPSDPQLVVAVRRVTLVAAPAVLAITAPRTAAIDEALGEQDLLVIVTAEPEGPLAQLAAAGLGACRSSRVRPLGRGPARSLARAGVRAPRRCGDCSRGGP